MKWRPIQTRRMRSSGIGFGKWGDRIVTLAVVVLSPVLLMPVYMALATAGDWVVTLAFLANIAVIIYVVSLLLARWRKQDAATRSETAQVEAQRILDEMRDNASGAPSTWGR